MKQIPLTQGKFALVDDEDYEYLSQYHWYFEHGYARREVWKKNKRSRIYMHREIINNFDKLSTDHINGDKLDNRKKNLRKCTPGQNLQNSSIRKSSNKTSKFKGVGFHKRLGLWRARIKDSHLGVFKSENDAAKAYNDAALEMFGEFAKINVIN